MFGRKERHARTANGSPKRSRRLERGWIEEDVRVTSGATRSGRQQDTRQMGAAMKLSMSSVGCIAAFG
jgi:hypothetical protein